VSLNVEPNVPLFVPSVNRFMKISSDPADFVRLPTPGVHSHPAAQPFNLQPANLQPPGSYPPSIHTLAVHAGERMPRPDFTPVATPIYHSAAYIYEELDALDGVFAGTREGPVYARYGNPTLTALEGGEAALSYASGMAAIHGALLGAGARAGIAVVAAQDVYGRSSTRWRSPATA
jgi:hypothetical protein